MPAIPFTANISACIYIASAFIHVIDVSLQSIFDLHLQTVIWDEPRSHKLGLDFLRGQTINAMTDLTPAPNHMLEAVHCNYKSVCNTHQWWCRKYSLEWSLVYGGCKEVHSSKSLFTKCQTMMEGWMDNQPLTMLETKAILVPRHFHVYIA